MKSITITELQNNLEDLLEEILATGIPLEINIDGRKLRIESVEPVDKFANLAYRPGVINGDAEDLIHIEWEYNIDLPPIDTTTDSKPAPSNT